MTALFGACDRACRCRSKPTPEPAVRLNCCRILLFEILNYLDLAAGWLCPVLHLGCADLGLPSN